MAAPSFGWIDRRRPAARHPLNAGLAAWWLGLPGQWGGGTWRDITLGGLDGALTNGPAWAGSPVLPRTASLSFDGVDDYVLAPVVVGGPAFAAGTIELVITPTSAITGNTNVGVIDQGNPNNSNIIWRWSDAGGALRTYVQDAGGYKSVDSPISAWAAGRDYHVLGTWDSTTLTVFVDGVQGGTTACGTPSLVGTVGTLHIGQASNGGMSLPWAGLIRSCRLYTADKRQQAGALYAQALRGYPALLNRVPRVSWFVSAGGGDVTVALTGQGGTGSPGTTFPVFTVPLVGSAGTSSAGSVTVTNSPPLAGQGATASPGTVTPSTTAPVTGSAATSAAGTFGVIFTVPLSGQGSTTSAGTMTAGNDQAVALTGQAATAAAGTLTVTLAVPVTSSTAAASPGTVTPAASVSLTGTPGTAAAGTTTPGWATSLTGTGTTSSPGTMIPAFAVVLSGTASTSAAGTVTTPGTTVLVGEVMMASAGTLGVSVTLGVTGSPATATAGFVTVVIPNPNPPGLLLGTWEYRPLLTGSWTYAPLLSGRWEMP